MSVRLTLPLKRALTGPIFTLTTACNSVSESFSRLSQPGVEAFSVSASLSLAHTVALSAGSTNSPDIVTAMVALLVSSSSLTRRPSERDNAWSVDKHAGLGRNSPGTAICTEAPMCRNIKTLYNFAPPATDDEIRALALQFVRKLSGFNHPSRQNELAFNRGVEQVTRAARELLASLVTN